MNTRRATHSVGVFMRSRLDDADSLVTATANQPVRAQRNVVKGRSYRMVCNVVLEAYCMRHIVSTFPPEYNSCHPARASNEAENLAQV